MWDALRMEAIAGSRNLEIFNGLVCRKHGTGRTLVIPADKELRRSLFALHHDASTGGHLGLYRMIGVLSKRFWWKGMHADCKAYI